jgi:hypothetical protein
MRSQWEVITVLDAIEALKDKECGRDLTSHRMDKYKRDIIAGRWRKIPQGPVYDKRGILRDGQHRYAAMIAAAEELEEYEVIANAAGFSLEMWVTRDWEGDPESFRVMDTGDSRTWTDLATTDGIANGEQVRAVLRRIMSWEINKAYTHRVSPTVSELDETLARHPEAIAAGGFGKAWHAPVVPRSIAGFCWWLLSAIDEDQARFFMEGLRTGMGYETSKEKPHPVHLLRERIIRDQRANQGRGTFTRAEVVLWMIIRAWNMYRTGEWLKKIQLPEEFSDEGFIKPV